MKKLELRTTAKHMKTQKKIVKKTTEEVMVNA